jgi:hypothetical protein
MIRSIFSIVSLGCIFLLTACIGEDYDFTPPTMTVWYHYLNDYDSYELKEASVNWEGPNEEYKKTVVDFQSLGIEQNQIEVNAGSEGNIELGHSDFQLEEFQVSLWQNNEEIELPVNKSNGFQFPDSKGNYILEVNLSSDMGDVQYVGNIDLN